MLAFCGKLYEDLLFVKGLDSADVCYIVDYSFLEANRVVIIDLCDRVWTFIFELVLRVLASFD